MTMADRTIIKARCFCGANDYSASVPNSSLPLQRHLCQCNSCRHGTGALFYSEIDWPDPVPDSATLTKHSFSDNCDTYFCSTCGAHIFWHTHHPTNNVYVVPGLVQDPDSLMDITSHIFVGTTIDGGFSEWLPSIDGRPLPRWSADKESSGVLAPEWKGRPDQELKSDTLPAHCKCKGVEFLIKRPRKPDEVGESSLLLLENRSARTSSDKPLDPKEWWVRSENRYAASNCVCTDCRLSSGLEVVQWAYAPTSSLTTTTGGPYGFDSSTLKSFKSSENVTRYHCGRCGATIFYWADDRPEVIDIAVGILSAPSGARAEDWLDWRTRISYEEDATHHRLLIGLKEGLEAWGQRNGNTYD